jgi:exonuclease 3'-5' domain-containing protein 1
MEKAHDISIDEPCVAHQAILFMLDVLMRNNKQTMELDELYDSFGDKSFTPQMLRAVGGNEQGLKQFLLRYPSLFTVNGETISANSGGSQLPRISTTPERYLRNNKNKNKQQNQQSNDSTTTITNGNGDLINSSSSSSSSSSSTPSSSTDHNNQQQIIHEQSKTMKEIEQEAIAFFRKQISKREEDWLPIVSVAGHASQSSSDVRKFVGPQNEFKQFLLKYPHIFVVRDEYCGLKGKADVSTAPFPPPSPPPSKRRIPPSLLAAANGGIVNANILSRTHSFKNTNRYSACGNLMANGSMSVTSMSSTGSLGLNCLTSSLIQANGANLLNTNQNGGVVTPTNTANKPRLTPVEVKAVHYVMRILHKNGRMLLQTIPGLISRAPDQVSNIVGFTREDLIQFFKRHSAIFQLHPDGCVSVKQDAVKALILKDSNQSSSQSNNLINGNNIGLSNSNTNDLISSSSSSQQNPGIITSSGVVLRIFPKYGILNMDNNEQVFFDIQSCQFETFSDLTTILHTGDKLYFNAIIGPRDGSTKWRSLKTWIKMKPQPNGGGIMIDNMSTNSDADKSDDSSTSSGHLQGAGQYIQHHQNRFYHHQNMYAQQSTGGYYLNNVQPQQVIMPGPSGQNTPLSSSGGLPSSPTNLTVSTCINGGASSNSLSLNSNSIVNLDNDNINTTTNSLSNLNINNNNVGEFNQYQLELNGDLNSSTMSNMNNVDDQSNDLTNNLIHSSSTNNLDQLNNNINNTGKMSSSKTIHSFNNLQLNNNNINNNESQDATGKLVVKKSLSSSNSNGVVSVQPSPPSTVPPTMPAVAAPAENVTKLLKQSPDNISEREVSSVNSDMISIGCQTISTGDITLTNVYIE